MDFLLLVMIMITDFSKILLRHKSQKNSQIWAFPQLMFTVVVLIQSLYMNYTDFIYQSLP